MRRIVVPAGRWVPVDAWFTVAAARRGPYRSMAEVRAELEAVTPEVPARRRRQKKVAAQ